MASILLRLSVLLFVIVTVGAIGLNRSFNPQNVGRIQAHAIAIQISSSGNAGSIVFAGSVDCDAEALAPSDTCLAELEVQNTGEGRVRLSLPDMSVAGGLTTCGGGDWLTVELQNVSYGNNDFINEGAIETFEVLVVLDYETPNDCQGQEAEILIEITADCIDGDTDCNEDPAPTPAPTSTPILADEDEEEDVISEVAGVVVTPTLVSETAGSVETAVPPPTQELISEVLPERFPLTGHGSFSDEVADVVELILLGSGLLAGGLLLIALSLYARDRRQER